MTVFLPTCQALLELARLLELEPNDPAAVVLSPVRSAAVA
jgi:hypothetical protein